jgi:hypothetical protein
MLLVVGIGIGRRASTILLKKQASSMVVKYDIQKVQSVIFLYEYTKHLRGCFGKCASSISSCRTDLFD